MPSHDRLAASPNTGRATLDLFGAMIDVARVALMFAVSLWLLCGLFS